MKQYYIGVDGGGTKTAIALARANEPPVTVITGSGCSYQMVGIDGAVAVIVQGVDDLLRQASAARSECFGCCVGLPCYGEDARQDAVLTEKLQAALAPIPVHIVNDVEVGWAGALECGAGIHLVAGTGSIAFAKNAVGKTARCGGWNEFFGDEGSCYWLGREAMSVFSKQADGRLPRGALYEIVRRELALGQDLDFIDLVIKEYAPYRDKVASFQRLAAQAALAEDVCVLRLYDRAARELAQMAGALKQQLELPDGTPVSYSGGLFQTGNLILKPLKKEVAALHCRLLAPRRSALEGAVLLAEQKYNT